MSDGRTPHGRRALSKSRMEGFSDGVFGFSITLLVVDLAVRPPGTALQQLLNAWPSLVAYLVSFLTIGAAWLGHSALTEQLARVDSIFLRLNLLGLLAVAFLPFPTRLVADALLDPESQRVFVTMYGITLLAIRLLGGALDGYARHEDLYSPREDAEEMRSDRRKLLPVGIGYVVAILLGFVFPELAVALYAGIAVYAFVPFRKVARLLLRRS